MKLRTTGGGASAGKRDRWVTIQTRPDDSVAPSGFPIDAPWADLATVAMSRTDVETAEAERSAQTVAVTTTQWDMPYMVEMDPELVDVQKLRRLVYAGRWYDVIGAATIGRAAGIALLTDAYGKTPTEATP